MVLIVLACNRRREMAALSDNDRAFTERWMHGESYALRRGVPLVVLTDGEETVADQVVWRLMMRSSRMLASPTRQPRWF